MHTSCNNHEKKKYFRRVQVCIVAAFSPIQFYLGQRYTKREGKGAPKCKKQATKKKKTMDYKSEQEQEIEVLESIYPEELNVISGVYPNIQFEVSVALELRDNETFNNDLLNSLTKLHTLLISFQLPDTYPDTSPIIGIQAVESPLNGDDEDSDGEEEEKEEEEEFDEHGDKVIKRLENLPDEISFSEYIPELLVKVNEQIETDMLIGMQMCFSLISSIKENAENWFVERLNELVRQHDLEIKKREAEEQKKFTGTKVTKGSFEKWRNEFRKELGLDERDRLRRLQAHNGRLTGKQMFEQGLVGTGDDMVADGVVDSTGPDTDTDSDIGRITKDLQTTDLSNKKR